VQDYITQEDFIARLAELGYRKKDIDLYLLMALDAKLQSAETETTNELPPQEPQQPTG
jgi:serine protease inhibitor